MWLIRYWKDCLESGWTSLLKDVRKASCRFKFLVVYRNSKPNLPQPILRRNNLTIPFQLYFFSRFVSGPSSTTPTLPPGLACHEICGLRWSEALIQWISCFSQPPQGKLMRRRNSGLWQLSVLMYSKLLCNYWSVVCAAKEKKKIQLLLSVKFILFKLVCRLWD